MPNYCLLKYILVFTPGIAKLLPDWPQMKNAKNYLKALERELMQGDYGGWLAFYERTKQGIPFLIIFFSLRIGCGQCPSVFWPKELGKSVESSYRHWKERGESPKGESQRGEPQILCKNFPNSWLIPEPWMYVSDCKQLSKGSMN